MVNWDNFKEGNRIIETKYNMSEMALNICKSILMYKISTIHEICIKHLCKTFNMLDAQVSEACKGKTLHLPSYHICHIV
jgi:hypothetical protein